MRRSVWILIGCLCLILCAFMPCFGKEWRGIVPLRSTRADVAKLLGDPKLNLETGIEYFDFPEERVTIRWIDPTCEREYPVEPESAIRPADLVFHISILRKKPLPMKELELDPPKSVFTTMGCHPNGPCTLWNDEEGYGFTSSPGGVTGLYYSPTADEFKAWQSEHKACEPRAPRAA